MAENKNLGNVNAKTKEKKGFFKGVGDGLSAFFHNKWVRRTAKIVGYGSLVTASGLGVIAGVDTLQRKKRKYIDVTPQDRIPESNVVDSTCSEVTEDQTD